VRLIDLIWRAIHAYPQSMRVEVQDLYGNIYHVTGVGQTSRMRIIGGQDEKVFLIRAVRVDSMEKEQ